MVAFNALDETENDDELVEVRLQLHDIAQSEITRHSNRLALLTTEQRSAVESRNARGLHA